MKIFITSFLLFVSASSFGQARYEFPDNFNDAKSVLFEKLKQINDSLTRQEPVVYAKRVFRNKGARIAGRLYKNKKLKVRAVTKKRGFCSTGKTRKSVFVDNSGGSGPSKIRFFEVKEVDGQIVKLTIIDALPEITESLSKVSYIKYQYSMDEVITISSLNYKLNRMSSRTYLKFN